MESAQKRKKQQKRNVFVKPNPDELARYGEARKRGMKSNAKTRTTVKRDFVYLSDYKELVPDPFNLGL